ncbi:Two-component response regulator-like APRR1 [Parelaphostrongylus tenuis]|uniref:Two-component response regulator-like APRR1 n=1 Tax=Parelaphostrongylus tenuis TaxID=148309 RepID=A0AAD5MIK6_PARTN|nr:Two-component response regulator-like APRR1 [Parelaphostrongylus tenuis]
MLVLCEHVSFLYNVSAIYIHGHDLQTAPPHLLNQIDRCISEASTVEGVLEIRSRHFWQLDFDQLVGTADVRVRRDADE